MLAYNVVKLNNWLKVVKLKEKKVVKSGRIEKVVKLKKWLKVVKLEKGVKLKKW